MDYVTVGRVVAAHGIKGEVKILVTTDFPERFDAGNTVRVKTEKEVAERKITASRESKGCIIAKLSGIDTRNDAEDLRGAEIVITENELGDLGEDRFYLFDLMGMTVTGIDGRDFGTITEVLQGGANDVYVTDKGVLVPALKAIVKKVDVASKAMIIDPPEGLPGA
ncbi:MAG: 16S rRNA processing protein RimM [Abditibacteriota bacterium]|nr:16S rRNA processing protein RimM [Abditibacteriota bacterium]